MKGAKVKAKNTVDRSVVSSTRSTKYVRGRLGGLAGLPDLPVDALGEVGYRFLARMKVI